jgi:hypothetical protein
MAIYWYNIEHKRTDWDAMNVSELTLDTVGQLDDDSIILLHMSDVRTHWSWLANAANNGSKVLNRLGAKIKANEYGELVFFTGGAWALFDNDTTNCIEIRIPAIFVNQDVRYFKCLNHVPDSAAEVFGGFVTEYHKSGGKLRARDWFDPQLGELKTTFRLLVQVWLVATDQAGDHDSSGNLKGMIKNQWNDLIDGFWKPVASDAEGKVLHAKLQKAHRAEGEPEWKSIDLNKLSASDLRSWAFSDRQSGVNSK